MRDGLLIRCPNCVKSRESIRVGADMRPDQAWDLIWYIAGIAIGVVLAVVFAVPIVNAIRDNLYRQRMRRHFSDTRGRRDSRLGPPNGAS
jgi:hypothetical protein